METLLDTCFVKFLKREDRVSNIFLQHVLKTWVQEGDWREMHAISENHMGGWRRKIYSVSPVSISYDNEAWHYQNMDEIDFGVKIPKEEYERFVTTYKRFKKNLLTYIRRHKISSEESLTNGDCLYFGYRGLCRINNAEFANIDDEFICLDEWSMHETKNVIIRNFRSLDEIFNNEYTMRPPIHVDPAIYEVVRNKVLSFTSNYFKDLYRLGLDAGYKLRQET